MWSVFWHTPTQISRECKRDFHKTIVLFLKPSISVTRGKNFVQQLRLFISSSNFSKGILIPQSLISHFCFVVSFELDRAFRMVVTVTDCLVSSCVCRFPTVSEFLDSVEVWISVAGYFFHLHVTTNCVSYNSIVIEIPYIRRCKIR